MKPLTVLCNAISFASTTLVVTTDGVPRIPVYVVLALLLLLVPLFTVFAVVRRKTERVAAVCNIILLGFVCWAVIEQYPPPEGVGVFAFAAFIALTLTLSAAALFLISRRLQQQRPVVRSASA